MVKDQKSIRFSATDWTVWGMFTEPGAGGNRTDPGPVVMTGADRGTDGERSRAAIFFAWAMSAPGRRRGRPLWMLPVATMVVIGIFLTGACRHSRVEPHRASIIILISIDTLRADRLGGYGNPLGLTPNLDAFAREAVVFSRSCSQSGSTLPSHASLFTSQYPADLGVVESAGDLVLPESVPTLMETLRHAGYYVASFNGGGYVSGGYGFDRGVDLLEENLCFAESIPRVIEVLESRHAGSESSNGYSETGLFVFLHSYDVHTPYLKTFPFSDLYQASDYKRRLWREVALIRERLGGRRLSFDDLRKLPTDKQAALMLFWLLDTDGFLNLIDRREATLMFGFFRKVLRGRWREMIEFEEQRATVEACYNGAVRQADSSLGLLFSAMKRTGAWDRSLIVICSDHGEEFMEHGALLHPPLFFDTLMHTPLLVKPPLSASRTGIIDAQVGNIDLFPTICAFAGCRPFSPLQGRSLVEALYGHGFSNAVYLSEEVDMDNGQLNATLLTNRFKIIQYGSRTRVAYDRNEDPAEQLSDENGVSGMPDQTEFLTTRVTGYKNASDRPGRRRHAPDDELRDRLQRLGYIN
ncbi:sulfatase [bacterium]|nr:sulfatase [candidate division CSSED10-310 bacterium]